MGLSKKLLIDYDIPYDKITNKKVGGIIIDDKAIRFTNWRDMLNYFVEW